ncbi:enoyl-CoA hydratase/isomerase family protein [Natronorubrum aibiense]|uniref:Peptide ABC transporter substrate-binding protein n=1 Tax=Natronorubrum aibiense TaxID=348826 RepID=A0A5P9P9A8_9EURY|nr:enoyl-CoA hydratase-related protein [Natronorubrum aibiense]QFU84684.1 peptide ABC transporter substrate-binding protein [Natronorubrum aibiense]
MADRVLLECRERIATITVNRPAKRNAMDVPTREDLRAAFEAAVDDADVRAIVLRGAGDGSFIAGGDIDSFTEFDLVDGLEYGAKHGQGLYNFVANVPKPTIAAVDGYALGGGTEIALACDIRLATPDAVFGLPEIELGIIPGGGGTQRLVHVVGAGIARELVLTGRLVDASEAAEIGLVNHVYSEGTFDDEVTKLATQLAAKAPIATRLAKDAIDRSLNIEQGLDFERVASALLFGTDDQKEGARAFLEGREPEYRGT